MYFHNTNEVLAGLPKMVGGSTFLILYYLSSLTYFHVPCLLLSANDLFLRFSD
jgi:hypothetical protein